MPNTASRLNDHSPTCKLHTPAEVYLFHMGKKFATKASQRLEEFGSATKCCTRDPKQVAAVIVLPLVTLRSLQYSTTTEWIAQIVDISARRPRILKAVALGKRQYLRAYGCHIGLALHNLDQWGKPPLIGLDIGVKQHKKVVAVQLLQRSIVALGKSIIAVELHNLHTRKLALQHLDR